MRVGMRNEGQSVQRAHPPIHRRVGRQAGFHSVDVRRQIAKARFDAVEPGKSAEHGEMGRPDMRGDELGFRTGLQRQFQQVAAVQAQDCLLYTSRCV